MWQQAWLSRVALRDRSQEKTKSWSGVLVGCSCLALSPHRSEDLTTDKAVVNSTFNLWERGWELQGDLWEPPVISRVGAGSPEGTLPLKGASLYSVIHHLHEPWTGFRQWPCKNFLGHPKMVLGAATEKQFCDANVLANVPANVPVLSKPPKKLPPGSTFFN